MEGVNSGPQGPMALARIALEFSMAMARAQGIFNAKKRIFMHLNALQQHSCQLWGLMKINANKSIALHPALCYLGCMKNISKIECPNCHVIFQPTRDWQKFCSAKCRTQDFQANHVVLTKVEYEALVARAKGNKPTVKK